MLWLSMNALHWIGVGLLIGLGIFLFQYVAVLAVLAFPFAVLFMALLLTIFFSSSLGRALGGMIGRFRLWQGWMARARR